MSTTPPILQTFPGRNPVEKSISYLLTHRAGFASLSWSEQVRAGGEFLRELESDPKQVRLSATDDKNRLVENAEKPVDSPVEDDSDDDEQYLSAAKQLVEALSAALKSGDVKALRALMTAGEDDALPADDESRQKAVQACAGRNDIERSASFLMSHPATKDRFSRVPIPLRPYVAGKFFRKGDVEWNEVFA